MTALQQFQAGVWQQHLRAERGSAVKGVRMFFGGHAKQEAPGADGYVCVLPQTQQELSDGVREVSLASMKQALKAGKAWQANMDGLRAIDGRAVPVIFMACGRPADKRFGSEDRLLGRFTVTITDEENLACRLTPTDDLDRLTPGRKRCSAKCADRPKRRIYSSVGAAPPMPFALTGAESRNLWLSVIRAARTSICINAYCMSDSDILQQLLDAQTRGVEVRVRLDARQQLRTMESELPVPSHLVSVSSDDRLLMHKKELLADPQQASRRLVVGSYNPTLNARTSQESAFLLTDAPTIQAVAERFEQDWRLEA